MPGGSAGRDETGGLGGENTTLVGFAGPSGEAAGPPLVDPGRERGSMEDLIARVAAAANIPADQARRAIGLIFSFLRTEGPTADVEAMFAMLPGAAAAAAAGAMDKPDGGGLMSGLMSLMGGGGGLMGLAAQLTGIGLGTGEMTVVGRELFAYAREKAGDERVQHVAAAIPGLSQLI